MSIFNIINLFGGLGLFLFGMNFMSKGINQFAGDKMKDLLEKLTRNPIKGFFLGIFVTAIVQSSSAVTVMVMGFLNAAIMDLVQATGVILGAHIGTTITAVLIAVDVSAIAPVCIFIGAALLLFAKRQNSKHAGQIILGFGILFFGLKYMSGDAAMGVLKTSETFQNFITAANNPFLGIIIGILICSVLQSSSAAIGVIQVLALQNLMPLNFAVFLIIGINVGSVTPLFISSFGAKTNAKRAALIYFLIDLTGMLVMTPIALFTPFVNFIEGISSNGSVQVAALHIIFKAVSAIVLLPFVKKLGGLSEKIIRTKEHESKLRFTYIDKTISQNANIAVVQVTAEVERMAELVRNNYAMACSDVFARSNEHKENIIENEEIINWLNHNISDYMITLTSYELSGENSEYIGKMFHVIADLERIGDHAINILERSETSKNEKLELSSEGQTELEEIYEKSLKLFDKSFSAFISQRFSAKKEEEIHLLENDVDALTLQAQNNNVKRLRDKCCHTSSGIIFTKLLQDMERVGDHSYNIAWAAKKDKDLIKKI